MYAEDFPEGSIYGDGLPPTPIRGRPVRVTLWGPYCGRGASVVDSTIYACEKIGVVLVGSGLAGIVWRFFAG